MGVSAAKKKRGVERGWPMATYGGRRAVRQDDAMGCGVACVAFVTGLAYNEAAACFEVPARREARGRGYIRREMVAALKKANSAYRLRYFGTVTGARRAQVVPSGAIVFVWNGKVGHYVVRHEDVWMCPLQGFIPKLAQVPTCYLAPV